MNNQTGRTVVSVLITIGVAAILGAALVSIITVNGPIFVWDTNFYLIIAEQFAQGNPDRVASYAPLISWMLGVLKIVTGDTMLAVKVYLFIVWIAMFMLIGLVTPGRVFPGLFLFAVLFANPGNANQFSFLLTEPFYGVLAAGAFGALLPAVLGAPAKSALSPVRHAVFLTCIALLPLQRYIGGYVVVALAIVYLLTARNRREFSLRTTGLAFAALPFALVLIWNTLMTGALGGYRGAPVTTFAENTALMLGVLMGDLRVETALFVVAALGSLGLTLWLGRLHAPFRLLAALLFLSVPAIQLGAQVATSSQYELDLINPRYAVTLLPLVAVLVLWLVMQVVGVLDLHRLLIEPVALVMAAAMFTGYGWSVLSWPKSIHPPDDETAISGLLAQSGARRIAVIEAQMKHMYADDILTGQMTAALACPDYTVTGSLLKPGFAFVPVCEGTTAPSFVPVVFENWDILVVSADAVVVHPDEGGDPVSAQIRGTAPDCAAVREADGFDFYDLTECSTKEPSDEI